LGEVAAEKGEAECECNGIWKLEAARGESRGSIAPRRCFFFLFLLRFSLSLLARSPPLRFFFPDLCTCLFSAEMVGEELCSE
jgi:hypothetical protein